MRGCASSDIISRVIRRIRRPRPRCDGLWTAGPRMAVAQRGRTGRELHLFAQRDARGNSKHETRDSKQIPNMHRYLFRGFKSNSWYGSRTPLKKNWSARIAAGGLKPTTDE